MMHAPSAPTSKQVRHLSAGRKRGLDSGEKVPRIIFIETLLEDGGRIKNCRDKDCPEARSLVLFISFWVSFQQTK